MLPTHLTTNEVKDRSGTEVEFTRVVDPPAGKGILFTKSGGTPAYPCTINFRQEVTGAGLRLLRRSLVRVDKYFLSPIDNATVGVISQYNVSVVPVGLLGTFNDANDVNAHLISLMASRGASTTILFDGTGYGAEFCVQGVG